MFFSFIEIYGDIYDNVQNYNKSLIKIIRLVLRMFFMGIVTSPCLMFYATTRKKDPGVRPTPPNLHDHTDHMKASQPNSAPGVPVKRRACSVSSRPHAGPSVRTAVTRH